MISFIDANFLQFIHRPYGMMTTFSCRMSIDAKVQSNKECLDNRNKISRDIFAILLSFHHGNIFEGKRCRQPLTSRCVLGASHDL